MRLSVLEWAQERYQNTLRIASEKTGKVRDGWLEDAAYWHAIVAILKVESQRVEPYQPFEGTDAMDGDEDRP